MTGERLRNELTRKLEQVDCYYAEVKLKCLALKGCRAIWPSSGGKKRDDGGWR